MGMGSLGRKLVAAVLWGVEGPAWAVLLYLGAAVAGSAAQPPSPTLIKARDVTVHVVSNGYHVDLVLPAVDEAKDWRPLLGASPITEGAPGADWVAFGWGARAAYTEVGTIADLAPGVMARALAFDRTVMHVLPVAQVWPGPDVRTLRLAAPLYAALAAEVEASLAAGPDGAPQPLPGVTQGYGDAYFEAEGRFSPFRTCNVWAADMLRAARAPVGRWTPFAGPLMSALPRASSSAANLLDDSKGEQIR